MKAITIALAMFAFAAPAFAVSPNVRISQVYAGGTSAFGTHYKQDFIELFNASGFDVDISGWVLEFGEYNDRWARLVEDYFVFPAGSWIAGCSYVLVATGPISPTLGIPLPTTPDYSQITGPNLNSRGKVGLFTTLNFNVGCGLETPGTLVDKIAYGASDCAEGTAAAQLTASTGAVRNGGGSVDTDDNLADFTIVTLPVPHNRLSPATDCAPVAIESQSWGSLKSTYR